MYLLYMNQIHLTNPIPIRNLFDLHKLLLATLCTSLFFVFSQIKIRYSIKYSDALSVRLFYTVPSVIIYEFLLIIRVLPIFDEPPCDNNKRSRNLPDQSLVSRFPLHHMGFPICKQYYDNLIC